MKIPLQITFRDMPPSEAIEADIREKAGKLDSLCDNIMSCRVIIEAPHRHHHKGKAYVVRIDMTVPGDELVINREPKRLEGYGFIETSDGKDLYFHKNSVLPPGFRRLRVGAEVHYAEELGDKGPQASSVRMIGRQ